LTITVTFAGCANEVVVVPAPVCTCETPVLTTGDITCNGNTYSVIFFHNGQTFTASAGTVSGNNIINIPIGTNVVLTSSNGTGCSSIITVASPASCPTNCSFPDLTVGQAICVGQTYNVSLTENTGATVTVSAGTRVGNMVINIPIGTNVTITGTNGACVSQVVVTSPVSCTDPCNIPPISISGRICSNNSTSYTVNYSTISGATVTANVGTVNNGIVSGIPAGQAVTITVFFGGCTNEIIVVPAPVCTCETPLLTIGEFMCIGANYRVEFIHNGQTISASAGTVSGNSVINIPIGTNVVITSSNGTGCETVLTYNSPASCITTCTYPDLTVGEGICVGTSYTVSLTESTGATLTVSAGTRVGNTLINIPLGTNVTITAINGACVSQIVVTSPTSCNDVCRNPPISISGRVCSSDNTSYSINYTTIVGATVTSTLGAVGNGIISGIPTGLATTITATFAGCASEVVLVPALICPRDSDYNIRMVLDTVNCIENTFCYEVQLSSANGFAMNLAGQNYRLYYDGSKMSYLSGTSLLPVPTYTNYTLAQIIENQDASATNGALSFEANLSFLNYSMDLNDLVNGGVILPENGSWVGTSELCFNAAFDLSDAPLTCIEAVWARTGLTDPYATAFVEVAKWVGVNNTVMAIGSMYDDISLSDPENVCNSTLCLCETPVLTTGDIRCNGNTYSFSFIHNGQTITTNAGTISGNNVINIPIGTNVIITSSNGLGCSTVLNVTSPLSCPTSCSFPDLTVGEGICVGNAYTVSLTETTGATITVSAGTRVGNTVINIPIGTNVTITATNGACVSQIVIISPTNCIDPCSNPPISISGPVCTNNNTNYSVNYTAITGATVTASHGTVNNGVISGVPAGQALTITVTFAGCTDEVVIVPAPTCTCEKPVLTIGDFTCNGNTYNINFFHNGQTISANTGTVSGNSVINIPIGTNVAITSSNGAGCTTILTYTSPASCVTTCSYPDLTVGQTICVGTTYTVSLTETTGATITVSAGTRVGNTVINIPIGTNVTITATNGACVSQTVVTSPASCIDLCSNPAISISGPVCTNNNTNYTVNYTTIAGATVTASHGTVNNGVISGVPAGQALTITVTFAGCADEVVIVPAPTCTCEKPVLTIGDFTCNGNTYNVNFFHNGQTISANAGTVSGNSVINIPIGTNVAITSSNGAGCTSILTYTSPASCVTTCSYPDLTVGEGICVGTTYTLSLTETTGATITVSAGTRVGNTVINIPIGTNVTITATNGACVSQTVVTSPASCIDLCSNPAISISGPVCTNNNANYSVNYTTITGATVTASHGTVTNGVISGVPAGQALTITVTFAGCANEVVVVPAPTCFVIGSIGNFVWHDLNGNGIQNGGEPGIPGVLVKLYRANGNFVNSTFTDINGFYLFENLPSDSYYLEIITPNGFQNTFAKQGNAEFDSDVDGTNGIGTTSNFVLSIGQQELTKDAGFFKCVPIGDLVWYDINKNDLWDTNENGINGLEVNLWRNQGGTWILWETKYTGFKPGTPSDDGYFKFCAPPGQYYVQVVMPPLGLVRARPNIGNNEENDSDITNENGQGTTATFTVLSGQEKCDLGAGYYPMAVAGNLVWRDDNQDGVQNANEPKVSGVVVQAFNAQTNTKVAEATTDEEGKYTLDYLERGDIYVKFQVPAGYSATAARVAADNVDSDVDHSYGPNTTRMFAMSSGLVNENIDLGIAFGVLPVEWLDVDAKRVNNTHVVSWRTAKEVNVDYYVVERRLANENVFTQIPSKVAAAGNANTVHAYSHIDIDVASSGVYIYRVKQIDFDGKFTYSKLVSLNHQGDNVIELYPNPARNDANIQIVLSDDAEVKVEMYDASSKLVKVIKSSNIQLAGDMIYNANLSDVPAGVYNVIVTIDGVQTQKKFIRIE
jgi:hypothetical protein